MEKVETKERKEMEKGSERKGGEEILARKRFGDIGGYGILKGDGQYGCKKVLLRESQWW